MLLADMHHPKTPLPRHLRLGTLLLSAAFLCSPAMLGAQAPTREPAPVPAAQPATQQPATRQPATPAVGEPAPAFRLNDHTGKATAVGGTDKDGTWTVLAFYPKAATPG